MHALHPLAPRLARCLVTSHLHPEKLHLSTAHPKHLNVEDSSSTPRLSRLAQSAYNSPYTRAGAPTPHPNTDPYAALRAKALMTLEAMVYDPSTMVERGIIWAEDQDPFGHVMQSYGSTTYISLFPSRLQNIRECVCGLAA